MSLQLTIIAGIFTCLNDEDIDSTLQFLSNVLFCEAVVYVREPVGTQEWMTMIEMKHRRRSWNGY